MVTTAEKNALNGYWETSREFLLAGGNQEPTDEQIKNGALLLQRRDLARHRSRSSSLASSSSSASAHETPDTSFEPHSSPAEVSIYREFHSLVNTENFDVQHLQKFLNEFSSAKFQEAYQKRSPGSTPLLIRLVENLNCPAFCHLVDRYYSNDLIANEIKVVDEDRGYNILHCWANDLLLKSRSAGVGEESNLVLLQKIKSLFNVDEYQLLLSTESKNTHWTPADIFFQAVNIDNSTYYESFIELIELSFTPSAI